MREKIKRVCRTFFPGLFFAITSYRFFSYCKREFGPLQAQFRRMVYGQRPITVLSGPFSGMHYFDRTVWGPITPKWIGSYEAELHSVTEQILKHGYSTIIDVGAAEGYYAVGLAKRLPETVVLSFDVDPIARRRQHQLCRLNDVSNLSVHRYCSHDALANTIDANTLIICDIEGFEYELLDPEKVQALQKADLLVEIHPFNDMTATEVREALERRFAGSHRIHRYKSEPQDLERLRATIPALEGIDDAMLADAINERRLAPQEWLWMETMQRIGHPRFKL